MKKKIFAFVIVLCVCCSIPFVVFADASDYTRIDHLLSDFDENKEASVFVSASGFENKYYNAYKLTVSSNGFTAVQNDAIPNGDVLYVKISMDDPDGVVIGNAGDQIQFVIAGSASLASDDCSLSISAIVSVNGETKYWLLAPSMSPSVFSSFHYTNTFQADSTVRLLGMQFMFSNFDASVTNAPTASCSLTAFNTLNINKTQENINQITGSIQESTSEITNVIEQNTNSILGALTNIDGADSIFVDGFQSIQNSLGIPKVLNPNFNYQSALSDYNSLMSNISADARLFGNIVSQVYNYDYQYSVATVLRILLKITVLSVVSLVTINILKGKRN